jgi:hypothetical protein
VLQTGRPAYQSADGSTRPAMGDVDGDASEELVGGFRRNGDHELQVFDDLANRLAPMGPNAGFVTSADPNATVHAVPAPAP